MRKGEIAYLKQFLLFSQCFLQLLIFRASKGVIVWEWVKCTENTVSEVVNVSQLGGLSYRMKNNNTLDNLKRMEVWMKNFAEDTTRKDSFFKQL